MVSILLAYLLGSLPFAFLVARRVNASDLRLVGSGNFGAANVMRASGISAALLVVTLDIGKGAASVWLARRISMGTVAPSAAGFAAIIGHIYPIWLRFRGGKGVATGCGVFSLLAPLALTPAIVLFLAIVVMTRLVSLGSLIATIALPPLALLLGSPAPVVTAATAAAAVILFRHRSNVMRLRSGSERRLGTPA
jgi:glycerol-3-phosphate acyltransferase PlsY